MELALLILAVLFAILGSLAIKSFASLRVYQAAFLSPAILKKIPYANLDAALSIFQRDRYSSTISDKR